MSLFLPFRRATLLIPSGPAHDPARKHFFILLTDPHPHPETSIKSVLLVSISTVIERLPHDQTCMLYPGDHPFVHHKSYVAYQLARIEPADKLINGVKQGLLVPQGMFEEGVFARVSAGLGQSRHTAPNILNFFNSTIA